ncbi:transcriptional regulator with XRE-family HTH domain [Streptacidiphilus sp. MAP12-16]|uniref:helix-turn-helix transcriptional regulator n=1 Tax=Streptacidiphilus sp. MAP12-16 TaxID=3156300 RepID=UPI0035121E02
MNDGESLGQLLRRLRTARGWSQGRVAEKLNEISNLGTATRGMVYRWENGTRTPKLWLPWLARLFEVQRDLLEAATVRNAEPPPAATLDELLPTETDTLALLSGRAGREIGQSAVADLTVRVHGLRLADDLLAGGDLITPAFRELRAAVRLYRESAHTEDIGRALLVAIGEFAQIAGWIASDAGQNEQAERAYRLGISAAREAEDATLAGNLIGSLAYHYANAGHPADAVTLSLAALEEAGPTAPARARALSHDRAAWAYTKAKNAPEAMRSLSLAEAALADHTPGADEPGYLYWVDAGELKVMEARAYTELHRPLRAVPLLTDVLGRYDTTHARELALYLSWLAIAYADANEPEQAAETAERMISLSREIASERTSDRARVVLRRLQAFPDVPEVSRLLADHGHLLAA